MKQSVAALLAMLLFAVPLWAAACAVFCLSPNCHAQTVVASPQEAPPCPHEAGRAYLLGSTSVCGPAFACVCFWEQPPRTRPAHRSELVFAYTLSFQSIHCQSDADAQSSCTPRLSLADPLIITSPSILRI